MNYLLEQEYKNIVNIWCNIDEKRNVSTIYIFDKKFTVTNIFTLLPSDAKVEFSYVGGEDEYGTRIEHNGIASRTGLIKENMQLLEPVRIYMLSENAAFLNNYFQQLKFSIDILCFTSEEIDISVKDSNVKIEFPNDYFSEFKSKLSIAYPEYMIALESAEKHPETFMALYKNTVVAMFPEVSNLSYFVKINGCGNHGYTDTLTMLLQG